MSRSSSTVVNNFKFHTVYGILNTSNDEENLNSTNIFILLTQPFLQLSIEKGGPGEVIWKDGDVLLNSRKEERKGWGCQKDCFARYGKIFSFKPENVTTYKFGNYDNGHWYTKFS